VSRKVADVLCEMLATPALNAAMALSEMHSTLLSMLFSERQDRFHSGPYEEYGVFAAVAEAY